MMTQNIVHAVRQKGELGLLLKDRGLENREALTLLRNLEIANELHPGATRPKIGQESFMCGTDHFCNHICASPQRDHCKSQSEQNKPLTVGPDRSPAGRAREPELSKNI